MSTEEDGFQAKAADFDSAVMDADVAIVEDVDVDEDITIISETLPRNSNFSDAENAVLKVRNAELLAELKKVRSELAYVKKKNQEIVEFATDMLLESKKK